MTCACQTDNKGKVLLGGACGAHEMWFTEREKSGTLASLCRRLLKTFKTTAINSGERLHALSTLSNYLED